MLLLSNKAREKNRVSQLYDIIDTISSSQDMKELLEATLNKTLKALSSERGSIFLAGDDGQELFLKWSSNTNSSLGEVRAKLGEGIVGKVAMERVPVLVRDIRSDSRFHINNMYHNYKTNSFLCAPISTDVRLIGVINVTENKSKKPYSEKDLRFLKIIADHIALKIEKSQLLSEIEQFKKRLERDGRFTDLGKFAGSISHELNNPLDGVIRYVNLALSSLGEGVTTEYLLEAKSGLKRITGIMRSLLELARRKSISQAQSVLADVNKVIEDCISLLQFRTMYKSVEINKNLSPDLPMIPDLGIESVFSNILTNALDALGEKGSINISTSLKYDFIEVAISDTGCGISKDNISRIFEPFFTTKEITKGSGLGLSICYDIVSRYNGRIDVLSEPDKGSTFTIYLPCKDRK